VALSRPHSGHRADRHLAQLLDEASEQLDAKPITPLAANEWRRQMGLTDAGRSRHADPTSG
jgi:hypothetical protein